MLPARDSRGRFVSGGGGGAAGGGGVQIYGLNETQAFLKNVTALVDKEAKAGLLEAANVVMEYAKTERFRDVPGANEKKGGALVVSPIPGILTRRSGTYKLNIGPPIPRGVGRIEIPARVPYAAVHEDDRPVLTKALADKEEQIFEIVGRKVFTAVEKAQ